MFILREKIWFHCKFLHNSNLLGLAVHTVFRECLNGMWLCSDGSTSLTHPTGRYSNDDVTVISLQRCPHGLMSQWVLLFSTAPACAVALQLRAANGAPWWPVGTRLSKCHLKLPVEGHLNLSFANVRSMTVHTTKERSGFNLDRLFGWKKVLVISDWFSIYFLQTQIREPSQVASGDGVGVSGAFEEH